jgi:tetratricopeptide (TPR) repeat protein
MDGRARDPHALAFAAAVGLAVLVVFAPALRNGFIDLYDDPLYVLSNDHVRAGLSASGVAWSFTTTAAHNWHPLTWLSHMADVSLVGLAPWGHHLTSILLHACCAVLLLLFALECGLGGWAAAFVACAFALHPLRVQSVAWIAERKDVLSGAFALATLLIWLRWTQAPSRARYAAALVTFALGLLAKPMLVSLPAALLLLDLWPLGRTGPAGPGWRRLAWEKVPFAALSVAISAVTMAVQSRSGAVQSGAAFPLDERLANAAVVPFLYLGKTVWPAGLSVYYPHPGADLPVALAVAAAATLAAITAAAFLLRGRAPYLLVGWLWFLVTLLPVIGIVQVGRQGMADRYTYLPLIGPVLALAAAARARASAASRDVRTGVAAAGATALVALGAVTVSQVALWRDSETLFRHAAEVTERNAIAANGLGVLAARAGRLDEALARYARAVEDDPGFGVAQKNYAALLLSLGRVEEAALPADAAARLMPDDAPARFVHGAALAMRGHLDEAAAELEAVLALQPDHARARAMLAQVRAELGAGAR